jgi:hypothetical protein
MSALLLRQTKNYDSLLTHRNPTEWITKSKSTSKSHCDRRSVSQSVSKSWCRAPSGAHDQIFNHLWQLRSCFCGAPSLTKGRVCLLYMLLTLASVLGSEFLRTRNHIWLSQIWDVPFRCLIRLAGSRWRYSTPPPHGGEWIMSKSKSKSHCDWRLVSQKVLVSSPIWDSWPDI